MANKEHLDILKQSVETWNRWRKDNPGVRPDLSEAELEMSGLWGADLRNADLRNADLRKAFLSDANLSGAVLGLAKLAESDLSNANLQEADLTEADLEKADLERADLQKANLQGARLRDTNLKFIQINEESLSHIPENLKQQFESTWVVTGMAEQQDPD